MSETGCSPSRRPAASRRRRPGRTRRRRLGIGHHERGALHGVLAQRDGVGTGGGHPVHDERPPVGNGHDHLGRAWGRRRSRRVEPCRAVGPLPAGHQADGHHDGRDRQTGRTSGDQPAATYPPPGQLPRTFRDPGVRDVDVLDQLTQVHRSSTGSRSNAAQPGQRHGRLPLHGPVADAQHLGRVGDAQVLGEPQQHHRPLAPRQPGQRGDEVALGQRGDVVRRRPPARRRPAARAGGAATTRRARGRPTVRTHASGLPSRSTSQRMAARTSASCTRSSARWKSPVRRYADRTRCCWRARAHSSNDDRSAARIRHLLTLSTHRGPRGVDA